MLNMNKSITRSALLGILWFVGGLPVWAQTCDSVVPHSTPTEDFSFHEDGTVTHLATKLIWMRCTVGQYWDTTRCRGSVSMLSWDEAVDLARDHSFAGRSDWRLPTIEELATVVERRCQHPSINKSVFPDATSDSVWSSTSDDWFSIVSWYQDFGYGSANGGLRNKKRRVRLVRNDR